MRVLEADKPFEIQEIELLEWKPKPVKNNFFEFVFVREGSGTQCIDYNDYSYSPGSMFLLPPLKCHKFNIANVTKFIFIKFTDSFLKMFTNHL